MWPAKHAGPEIPALLHSFWAEVGGPHGGCEILLIDKVLAPSGGPARTALTIKARTSPEWAPLAYSPQSKNYLPP